MADRVPYTGAPEGASAQGPRFEPTPAMHIDAPAAAFGVNVAQAVTNLGEVQEGAGKELFARALAFQDLTNHATARGAALKTTQEQGQLWGDFDSKGGMDAGPEALKKFQQDLENVRQRNGANLNPMAQELYQNDAASTQSRFLIYSASHSAQAVKQYDMDNINAGTATRHALVTGAQHIDENAAAQSWAHDEKDAIDLGHHRGEAPDSPAVKARIIENHNGTSLAAITGFINRHNPDGAQKFLTLAEKNGKISGEAIDKAEKMITDSQERVGTAETVAKTYDPTKTREENIKAAVAESDKKTGGDPVAAERVTSRVVTKSSVDEGIAKQNLDRANSTIDDFIHQNVGKAPLSFDDLKNNPDLKDAFSVIESDKERMGQTEQAINQRIKQAAEGDVGLTPERVTTANVLLGIAHTDPAAFVKTDLWKQNLNPSQRKELVRLQDGIRTSGSEGFRDRATEQVLGDMHQQIKDGIGERGTPEYNEFRGALQTEFDLAREQGKIIDPKMATDMATKLLQSKVISKGYLWNTTGHAYQPSDEQAAEIRKQNGTNLSDDMVNKIFLKKLSDVLINKTSDKAPANGQ